MIRIGDIIHYSLDAGPHQGKCRPAVVVRLWTEEMINLQVFVDGSNDYFPRQGPEPLTLWRTSVHLDSGNASGTWHYPEVE